MSSTVLEVTRAAHEEVERLERLIVKELQNEPGTNKERLYQSHRVRNMIDTITSTTEKLIGIYEDNDNARKDEIAALGGQTASGINVFSAFYDRLKEIREYHRKHPVARVVDANDDYEMLLKEEPQIEFSGEEALGRYLDLHELYYQYVNSKFGDPLEYSAYLDVFSDTNKIPRKMKVTRQYREYMVNLLEYLIYFFQRTEPLQDLDRIFSKVTTEFEENWVPHSSSLSLTHTMLPPAGTVVFNTVGRTQYGFDVFTVDLHHHLPPPHAATDHRLTDGLSINFNGQFISPQNDVIFVSERTGSPRFYVTRPDNKPQPLLFLPNALFLDRPIFRNGKLYFVSTHDHRDDVFTSWSAVYSSAVEEGAIATVTRLTPIGEVDYSPALSLTGKFLAVASYRSRRWQSNDFRELQTEIVVFPEADPGRRVTVSERGSWPTWSGDSTIFFHKIAEDGWWSIFRVNLTDSDDISVSENSNSPIRVTPPGLHCFTPAAFHDGKRIAVATRRKETGFRHVEIFDTESQMFQRITEDINPTFHHYNPFVSLDSRQLGYHRFRGESTQGESSYPHLDKVLSPVHDLQLLRLNGSFPSFSPDGDFIAFNHSFDVTGGVKIIRSNGSNRWTLLKGRTCFHNAWSPTEKNVIYTSIGPIFESVSKTVQIGRIEFDPAHLTNDREEVPFKLTMLTREETGNNAFPSCSPDGKSVVFRSGRSGNKNLYIVDGVEGEFNGGLRRLTEGPWIDTMPCWSPKGDWIAFSSNRHEPENSEVFGIYLVRPDGSGLRRVEVAKGVEGERERLNHVCFSGDGEWLVFTANLGSVTAEPIGLPNQFQPYGDLYVVKVDGSGLRRLTCNAYENGTPTWHHAELVLCGESDGDDEDWDKLKGEFAEPLWITCDL